MALHLKRADLVATAFDDVDAAAAHDPVHAIFIDGRVSCNTSLFHLIKQYKQNNTQNIFSYWNLSNIIQKPESLMDDSFSLHK